MTENKKSNALAKKLGLAGIALCGLCCMLPVIGAAIGMASLTAISFYLEKIGMLALGFAAFFFWHAWYRKRKKAAACTTSCACKTTTTSSD